PYAGLNTASALTVYDGASSKEVRTTRSFDASQSSLGFGNLLEATGHGLLTAPGNLTPTGDEVTTHIDYFPNASAFITGFPARAQTFLGVGTAGTKLRETQIVYDSNSTYDAAPTIGEAKKTRAWLDLPTPTYLESTAEYSDGYGNVTATVDPLLNRTEFIYD